MREDLDFELFFLQDKEKIAEELFDSLKELKNKNNR